MSAMELNHAPSRFINSVLYAAFGTTFCLPANQPEVYMTCLSPKEQAWVHHLYGDSRPSASEYGYDPATWWTFLLPSRVCHELARNNPPARLKPSWFERDVPKVNPHGGDGCPSGPALAAAWQMTELRSFIDSRVTALLETHPFGGEQPGERPVVVIASLFPGSSHGPGVTIPALAALNQVLKERGALHRSSRIALVTLPDFRDGVSLGRQRQQRANTMGFLLTLDAIHSKLRRVGAFPYPIGDETFQIENALVDAVILFGGQGKAGAARPEHVSEIVAHMGAIIGAQGTGVGRALADHFVRLRQIQQGGAGNHSTFFGRFGAYEIRFDKELAARRLGQRYTLVALRLLLSNQPAGVADADVMTLSDQILDGDEEGWLDDMLAEVWEDPDTSLSGLVRGQPNPDALEGAAREVERKATAEYEASLRRYGIKLEQTLESITDRALLNRLLDGYLDALGIEMEDACRLLEDLADEAAQLAEECSDDAEEGLEAARDSLLAAASDPEELRSARTSFDLAAGDAAFQQFCALRYEYLAEVLQRMSEKFRGRVRYTVRHCLKRLQDAVAEPRGHYYRRVEADVDWGNIQRPIRSLERLWSKEIEDTVFDETQTLMRYDENDNLVPRPGELANLLKAVGSGVAQALRRGDDRAFISSLEDYCTGFFAQKLEPYTFTSFCKTFYGGLEPALRDSLKSAFAFAHGWIMKLDNIDEVETQTIVEVPEGDAGGDELFRLTARLAKGISVIRKETGDRGAAPALIVAQAAHGYRLPDLSGFDAGGEYHKDFEAQYQGHLEGRNGPVLGDKRYVTWIAEEFAEWASLLGRKGP